MDEMQTKIDELKETMPSETYRQLCQETKRMRESQARESLFEVKYTSNTFISTHHYDEDSEDCVVCSGTAGLMQTKVMRGQIGCYSNAGLAFAAGCIYVRDTGELHTNYTPGLQFRFGKPGIDIKHSPYLTIYTILEIKPFTNKRNRTA